MFFVLLTSVLSGDQWNNQKFKGLIPLSLFNKTGVISTYYL